MTWSGHPTSARPGVGSGTYAIKFSGAPVATTPGSSLISTTNGGTGGTFDTLNVNSLAVTAAAGHEFVLSLSGSPSGFNAASGYYDWVVANVNAAAGSNPINGSGTGTLAAGYTTSGSGTCTTWS